MTNASVMLEFILDRNPERKPMNAEWVAWALQMVHRADLRCARINPEYLRAEFINFDDPEPPMFA